MKKLWQKDTQNSSKLVEDYCFSEDVILDNNLIDHDVYSSIAHAHALEKLKIITKQELEKLTQCLREILVLNKKGEFTVIPSDEDVHTKVENYLTEKLGELGKKIHTGRSRNDQVLVDLRLYAKENLFDVASKTIHLVQTFTDFAKKYEYIPMPGYTHMQKAMPSSIGMWSGSFAESLLDDLKFLSSAYELNNQSPLGSGAAYGLSLSIDRALISEMLGFEKVQNNSLYSQVSRPKIQLAVMQSLVQIMLTLSRFAQDLLLFTTSEFNFFTAASELCTGSSIMPQKKNLDIMEHLRAKTHVVIGFQQIVSSMSAGLISGYNADFSETKGPFMKTFEIISKTLDVIEITMKSLKPNFKVLEKAMTSELYATHAAYELVKKGMAFREAYVQIGKSLDHLPKYDSQEVLKLSDHIGGTGNLGLDMIKENVLNESKQWKKQSDYYFKTINNLIK